MSNFSWGNRDSAFYETLPGGAGATPLLDGTSAVQTHMTNTRNTPVEEFERQYPVRVESLTVRRRSGGRGRRRGGDGIVKELRMMAPAVVSVFADRHRSGPPGSNGGGSGKAGRIQLTRGRRTRTLPAKGSSDVRAGDVLRIETPGGGGWGAP